MKTDTPRTDEWETYCDECYYHMWRVRRKNERGFNDGFHLNNGEGARQLVELLNKQDSELTAARAELERLDTAGIHSCHDNCQRPNCVLRRELKAVTEQRDGLRSGIDYASDQLHKVTEQRDRLVEAMTRIKTIYENPEKRCIPTSSDMYDEALQSLTTNKEDQERKSPASDGSI